MEKDNLQELQELLEFAIEVHQTIAKVREDDKIDLQDVWELPKLVKSARKGLTGLNGITNGEIKAAMPYLIENLRAKFELSDHELELLIEDSLSSLFNLFAVGERWKNYFQNKRSALAA
jgi:hypothetical protein